LLNDQRLGRKEPNMMIIGVDYHPNFQTIAFLMEETGECGEQELNHRTFGPAVKESFLQGTILVGREAILRSAYSTRIDRLLRTGPKGISRA
jgi:hypothetical protein